jgi:hypothetical protein
MTVRLDAAKEDKRRKQQPPWRDLIQSGTSILAVSGILMYAILSIAYGRFYGSLGVNPSDVGLSYLNTLASSVGAILALLLVLIVASFLCFVLAVAALLIGYLYRFRFDKDFRRRILSGEEGMSDPAVLVIAAVALLEGFLKIVARFLVAFVIAARKYTVKVTVLMTVLIAILLAFYALPRVASSRADQVMAGKPVLQPRLPLLPLTLLAIRADPAYVAATGEPGKTPAVNMLEMRSNLSPPLLYLGQANSTVVLYDSNNNEAIYVPSSSLLLRVANCKARPTPPNC